jgi:aminomethyltransferase
MPVRYSNVIDEHLTTRNYAGLFDICHMGEIDIRGRQALEFLQRMLTRDLTDQSLHQMKLSLLLNDRGGILDDLTVYRLDDEHYRLVTNAATKDKDLRWLQEHRQTGGFDVSIEDCTSTTAKLDLQGPRAEKILQELVPDNLAALRFYRSLNTTVAAIPALVSRSGYTERDGFEIYVTTGRVGDLWDKLLHVGGDYGLKPVGLGARDTLRLEAGMMLYGQDMDETVTPYEVVYGWVIRLEKDFIGRDALVKMRAAGETRKLVGFSLCERGIARHGYDILKAGRPIGVVTSGSYAPSLEKAIGLAFVPSAYSEPGTTLTVRIRSTRRRPKSSPFRFTGAKSGRCCPIFCKEGAFLCRKSIPGTGGIRRNTNGHSMREEAW